MSAKQIIEMLKNWLYVKSKNEAVLNEDVMRLIMNIYTSQQFTKKQKVEMESLVGNGFVIEFLTDRCSMKDLDFWNKYFK